MKAGCEDEVVRRWGERALIVRPGLIVGPDDHTDRFGYWVRRLAAGGDVLAPAPGTFRARFIDAGDVRRSSSISSPPGWAERTTCKARAKR